MTSHIDLLTSDPNISAALHVRQARGTERLNQPFSVMLEIEYEDDAGLDAAWVKQLLTEPVGIRLHLADGPLEIHGQLRWLEMSGVTLGEKTTYGALLGPKVLSLEDTRRSRIFQDMDLPTLIRAVMSEAVLPGGGSLQEDVHYSLAGVTGTYPEVGDQIVQYEESDWAFLNRWLEHWGVHYHFRYEAVPGEAIMMFGDTNRAFPSYQIDPQGTPSDPKFDPSAGSINREGIWELRQRLQPQPASVVLRDYNWRKPEVGLQSQVPADVETGGGFRYFYGEHFKDPEEGQRIATLRAERLICERESVVGRASLPRLAPGASFVLRDHPLPDFTDLELRAVACVWTTALRTQSHPNYPLTQVHNRIELVRASLPWRPAHDQTPRPRVDGLMHGRVDGAVLGTAAPIDEHGRYKVLFPFDLIGNAGGAASRWIRVAQPSSGAGYGVHLPLHVGAEVMVAHLGGDPDRPVIVGSPHNATTVNPVTKKNPTQSQIRTQAGVRIIIDDDC